MKNSTETILKVILIYTTLFVSDPSFRTENISHPKQHFSQELSAKFSDEDTIISALTYNVWGLPIWMPGHDQSERFSKIADSILIREFEVICLQEVFHKNIRTELINTLFPHYFHASDYSCNKPIIGKLIQKDCHGGLMTLSKYPIISETFYQFKSQKNASIIERIGSKGFLFTTILWNGKPINIINTHLYAGVSQSAASHRMNQLLQLQEKLKEINAYNLYPTVLMGDVNITHPSLCGQENIFDSAHAYNFITKDLGFVDLPIKLSKDAYTINSDVNMYCSSNEPKQKLDYIMVHNTTNNQNAIWLSEQMTDFYGKSALSDHLGWKASINMSNLN